jgi:hypothetical protein
MCGQVVTFPAIPPGRAAASLHVKHSETRTARKWAQKVPAALAFLLGFQHWSVVAQCAVPFLVVGMLLAGAAFVKNKLGEPSAPVATPTVEADPQAWQKMTDLAKADQAVRDRMSEVAAAQATLATAKRVRESVAHMDPMQQRGADQQVRRAEATLSAVRKQFDAALTCYQRLGGTVDYRSQIPNY